MKKSFTLIEILIYSSLLTIAVSSIIEIMVNFIFFKGTILTREEVTRSVIYSLEDIQKEIRKSNEVTFPSLGNTSSELSLKEGNEDLTFELKEDKIIKKVGDRSFVLTPSNLKIRSLEFTRLEQSSKMPSSIRIKLEVEYNNPSHLREYDFFTSFQTAATQRK